MLPSNWPNAPSRLHKDHIPTLVFSAYIARGLEQHNSKLKSLLRVGSDPSFLYLQASVFLSGKLQLTSWCLVLHRAAEYKQNFYEDPSISQKNLIVSIFQYRNRWCDAVFYVVSGVMHAKMRVKRDILARYVLRGQRELFPILLPVRVKGCS